MSVTVTDRRTILNEADDATNWNIGATNTEHAEGAFSIATAYNIATGDIYYTTGTSFSITDTLLYVYSACNALQLSWTTWAHSLFVGDGTNQIAFAMAGGDRDVFKHADGPVLWQSFVLDGSKASEMDASGLTTAIAGSFASLALGSVTQAGGHYITQSKALGGGQNCFCDIIRYGNDGIRITGGTEGDEGTFLEIVLEDRSIADQKGHGIIRELSTDTYGVQGPLTFGSLSPGNARFSDAGIILVYEDREIDDDKYYFNIEGSGSPSDETYFTLTNSTIKSAGPYVKCDFSSGGIDSLVLTSVGFNALGNEILFANDVYASGHFITQCTFNECGIIHPGTTEFNNNTISSTTNPSGGLLIGSDGTDNLSALSFISDGTGHAIYMPTSGTYTFTDYSYSGYGANDTTDAGVYNNSSGVINIQVLGGSSPTVLNSAGSTTNIINTVTLSIYVENRLGVAIENASVYIEQDSNGDVLMNELTDGDGLASETYNYLADTDITIKIRKSTSGETKYFPIRTTGQITSTGFALTAVMAEDSIAAP